jgi:LysR family glycine cleavage system transcriptional activator
MSARSKPVSRRDRLPPLNALRNFEAVARCGSFAAAAADLHVTHWAVGKQIRLLESWFGIPLFERRARGVALTDEGSALLIDVSEVFDRLATGAARLRQDERPRRVSGVVRVNVMPSFALCWLLPRMADFNVQYPEIELRVTTTSRKLRYVGDAFDIGVRSGHEQAAGLVSRTLMPDLRLPACSPMLLRRHPIRAAADLRHHTLLHSATTRTDWSRWLKEADGPDPRELRHVEFDHSYLQLAAAVEGIGVTLASWPLIEREVASGRLICPISTPVWRAPDYALVMNSDRASDEAVTAFEGWLTTAASKTLDLKEGGPLLRETLFGLAK